MKKFLAKLLLLAIAMQTFYIPEYGIQQANAASSIWDFDLSGDYSYSNTGSFTITGSLAHLMPKNTLVHTGKINNATTYNGAYDVVVDGNYAYMTNFLRNSVSVINISNPAAPTFVSELVSNGTTIRLGGAAGIAKDGNLLYVASNTSDALQIIDVTNPAAPTATGQLFNATTLNGARGIAKVGNYVYLTADTYDALQVINVTNPTAPVISGTYRVANRNLNGARDVKVVGNYAYVANSDRDSLAVMNITNPAAPTFVSELRQTTRLNGAHHVEISGNYAYVSAYLNNSVMVINITNPAALTEVTNISGGSYSLAGPRDLLVDGNNLFISSYTNDAVNVADITDPATPTYVTKILHNAANPLLDGADGLFKVGNFIYVAGYISDSLEILKFQYDTTSPYLIPNTGYNYGLINNITSITETLGAGNEGSITYQISDDNGSTWYYWNGSAWASTLSGAIHSNSMAVINTQLYEFNQRLGQNIFKFKAFFTSDGDQKVELDKITLNTSDPPLSATLLVWLKSNAGPNTTTDGGTVTSWADQSGNGNDVSGSTGATYRYTPSGTGHLNFYGLVDFNGSTQYLENLDNKVNSKSYYMVIVPDQTVDGTLAGQVPFGMDCESGTLSSGTCGMTFAGVSLGAFTVAMNDEVVTHALGSSLNWRSAEVGAASYNASEPMLISVNEDINGSGTNIYEQGVEIDNFTANTYQTLSGADFRLGSAIYAANPFYFDGKIAEFLNFDARTTDNDKDKIESYLAFKYGITLANGTKDYVGGEGYDIMWDASNAGIYTHDIFGIGRCDMSFLAQPKSTSVNSDSVVTLEALSEGTNMSPSFVDIADDEFLTIANDNGSNTWIDTGVPTGYVILDRKWKYQEDGDVGTVNLDFDVGDSQFDIPATLSGSTYYYLYDTNNNDSLADDTPQAMTNVSGNIWRISGINPADQREFTIAGLSNGNNIPTNITLSNAQINENVASGSTIGTFSTTDADPGDTHSYSFILGAGDDDNSKFTISGSTLKIAESPDHELQSTYSIRVNTNDGNGGDFQKQFTISINDLGEAISTIIDFEIPGKYTVTSGDWSRTTNNPQEGSYSLESNNGGLPNTQSCFIVNNTLHGTGTIDFKYSVSSQTGSDTLNFYVDNVPFQAWSGSIAWSTYTNTNIPSGTHEYKWCYIKDGATNAGTDNAFVDYITFKTSDDTVPPIISSINFASGSLLPGGNHTIVIEYNDAVSGIDTNSALMSLQKWNGSSWGSDISATGLTGATVTSAEASYNTNHLSFGKYQYSFQIDDLFGNSSSTGAVFYIDEPELIISTGSIDIGTVNSSTGTFSDTVTIEVKTVGAPFEIRINSGILTIGGDDIVARNGSTGYGYEISPFVGTISDIGPDEFISMEPLLINQNGDRNSYTYNIKLGALIEALQSAGDYTGSIDFGIVLDY